MEYQIVQEVYFQIGSDELKNPNRKKKPKHHSKVKYKVYPWRKTIVSIVRECRCKKFKNCHFIPKQFFRTILTTNTKSKKYKIVSKQTYIKKY